MQKTLLYTVQQVLGKLDLDPVNSIAESQDALFIAREAETTYFDLFNRGDWLTHFDLLKLEGVSDEDQPTVLRLPDNVSKVTSVRFEDSHYLTPDQKLEVRELDYVCPEEFLSKSFNLNQEHTSTKLVQYKDIKFFVRTDDHPKTYTMFDNEHLVCDAYRSDLWDTLVGDKFFAYGKKFPNWIMENEFVIPVEANKYHLFLSELTAACAQYLTDSVSPEDERRRSRAISRMRVEDSRKELETVKHNFGRNGNGRS